jgi:hypothetical protein
VNEPEQIVNEPEQIVNEPEQIVNEPEQIVNEPEQIVNEPEQIVNEPEQIVNEPEQISSESGLVTVDFEKNDDELRMPSPAKLYEDIQEVRKYIDETKTHRSSKMLMCTIH